jgi:hypothetical protein
VELKKKAKRWTLVEYSLNAFESSLEPGWLRVRGKMRFRVVSGGSN